MDSARQAETLSPLAGGGAMSARFRQAILSCYPAVAGNGAGMAGRHTNRPPLCRHTPSRRTRPWQPCHVFRGHHVPRHRRPALAPLPSRRNARWKPARREVPGHAGEPSKSLQRAAGRCRTTALSRVVWAGRQAGCSCLQALQENGRTPRAVPRNHQLLQPAAIASPFSRARSTTGARPFSMRSTASLGAVSGSPALKGGSGAYSIIS